METSATLPHFIEQIHYILDLASAARYPVSIEKETWRQTDDLDFSLPVFSLEGVFITKLLAMRDNDVVDVTAILADEHSQIDAGRLYLRALEAGLDDEVQRCLEELALMAEEGEIEAIWLDRLGTLLAEEEKARVIERVRTFLSWFTREDASPESR